MRMGKTNHYTLKDGINHALVLAQGSEPFRGAVRRKTAGEADQPRCAGHENGNIKNIGGHSGWKSHSLGRAARVIELTAYSVLRTAALQLHPCLLIVAEKTDMPIWVARMWQK